jgi:hypothetical protein
VYALLNGGDLVKIKLTVVWPVEVNFILDHSLNCGRPRIVRAVMFYLPIFGQLFDNNTLFRWLGSTILSLIGGRCLYCVTCGEMVFLSKFKAFIFYLIHRGMLLINPGLDYIDEYFLYEENDINKFSEEEKVRLGIVLN